MLRKIRVLRPEMPVILITAWGTIPLAVEGMNHGATDFLTKPWSNKDLVAKIRKALSAAEQESKNRERIETLDDTEREAIAKALRLSDGNLSIAAQKLGITRQALYRRIEKYGL
jgi:DNA-binding NtrC family response regulator